MSWMVCKKKGTTNFLEMTGDATIHDLRKTKQFLLTLVEGTCEECTVDLSKIECVNLSLLQLLISFHKSMTRKNKSVLFTPLQNDHVVTMYMNSVGLSFDSPHTERG